MWDTIFDYGAIIMLDLVLSGDNALIIGMAAAGLAPELRAKAILYGMIIAAGLRIAFALIATTLIAYPGLRFVGALLLIWVCWRLFQEIRHNVDEEAEAALREAEGGGYTGPPKRTLRQALISITIADVSMSLDNVLAVAGIADGDTTKLVVGLGLAIIMMAFAATLIMKLLARYPWISWAGLGILIYVALHMLYVGIMGCDTGIGMLSGLIDATQCVSESHAGAATE